MNDIEAYARAQEAYRKLGVDTEQAIEKLDQVVVSLHCWQTDDVSGLESTEQGVDGGLAVTGNYPGRARNLNEIRDDLAQVIAWLPGSQKVSLHAMYADFTDGFADRDKIQPRHFESWIEWARELGIGLDFNATCFSHPMASSGLTLAAKEDNIRQFWVDHVKACRAIAHHMGQELKQACVHNLWIPDSSKDIPVNPLMQRKLLKESLDQIYAVEYRKDTLLDSVESKLFGIGGEAMTVGSHEFYLAYALQNQLLICLDNGHFHPTEQVADKISALLPFVRGLLLHMTRGIRWDSDHVVILNDEIRSIARAAIHSGEMEKICIGLDFFDASINRIGAYLTGARAVQQAFLMALLEPVEQLIHFEEDGKGYERLALFEQMKTMPFGAVWQYYCNKHQVPDGTDLITAVQGYETRVLKNRD